MKKKALFDWSWTVCIFWGSGFWSSQCRKEDEYTINVITQCWRQEIRSNFSASNLFNTKGSIPKCARGGLRFCLLIKISLTSFFWSNIPPSLTTAVSVNNLYFHDFFIQKGRDYSIACVPLRSYSVLSQLLNKVLSTGTIARKRSEGVISFIWSFTAIDLTPDTFL